MSIECLYPQRLSKKKKRKGRTVSKIHHSTASYRLPAEGSPGALETRLAYSAPPRHSKCGGQRDLFFLSKEVSLITLTADRCLYWILDLLLLLPNSPKPETFPQSCPRMIIGYPRCILYGDDLRPFCLTWPWILSSPRTRTVHPYLPTRFLLGDADHMTLWPRLRPKENQ